MPNLSDRPYIFVDVDGVIAPFVRNHTLEYDSGAIDNLAKLQRDTNGIVVISSTWCYDDALVGNLTRALTQHNVEVGGVCNYAEGNDKPSWILGFLTDRGLVPDKTRWIVLDDEDLDRSLVLKKISAWDARFVHVHPRHLLTDDNCTIAKTFLKYQSKTTN